MYSNSNSRKLDDTYYLSENIYNQKKALSEEITANKAYEKNLAYSDITGKNIEAPTAEPKPGINYVKAFEESKKNETKMDE